jgi:hypothetical protein
LNISTERVSDVQPLGAEADDYLDYCLSTQLCRKEEANAPQMQNVEIVDGRNL